MNASVTERLSDFQWPTEGVTRVPYRVFLDRDIYELEQERLYRGQTWNFVGLEIELAQPGDFKTNFVGDTPIVVTRDKEGNLRSFVNRCAHRGSMVCLENSGNRLSFSCPYHLWSYDSTGALRGVPFQHGISGKGGMEEGFRMSEHSLQTLNVTTYNGLVFVSFQQDMPSIETYLGQRMRENIDRVFNRPIQLLGYNHQYLQNNWKLYFENVKDSYHASLLHLFFATFGLNRLSQKGGIEVDETGGHHISFTKMNTDEGREGEYQKSNLRSYQSKFTLEDESLLAGRPEFDDGVTLAIQTIFPNLVVQQIYNTLAVRQIVPKGPSETELIWTYFGYADDDDTMRNIRVKQSNLIGPAGLISMEDGAIGEIVQKGVIRDEDQSSFVEMGGTGVESQEHRVTETSIRGFWQQYRAFMNF
ncbi:aromatic ring-hydroxylating dioxygenase subunit alpha [Alicyclobacillus fastidiosus]|uniref:Aromatic ring-hydroxylating dioxygenase subunit alpha n=1 Tax=Alicyclobacillus fastidiosus TaxID=392011 RepID=A0ABY6ZEC2_9BACL|nr:aromatic ring-hydroxylating dioxygenase subunit alpha [Alicyclobacillus fastidiosus]WAH41192.1 aromatic ring-hydroxylating dioxygenase subunit alpha [Alicyclobacillus fastidiosus]GMA62770.1 aromatic oxygenase [Alicyclobacillus fastidiosus]